MKKQIILIISFALLLVACQETEPIAMPEKVAPGKEVSYVIPQAEDVATLMDFMRETRSRADEEELWVDTVYTVVYPRSRAIDDWVTTDNCNYDNNVFKNLA